MVKAADAWRADDLGGAERLDLCDSSCRRIAN
jgi:hypothetical protein